MKSKILAAYPHFQTVEHSCDLYVVDYTLQTNSQREVEVHTIRPTDIDSFEIKNTAPIETSSIVLNNDSFRNSDGQPLTQCECISFPNIPAATKPWLLFLELKYCQRGNKGSNLNKAKKQLFETRGYLKDAGIIENKQPCYLIASLPLLNKPPFESFLLTPPELQKLKSEENTIIKGTNSITIKNESIILV